MITIEGTMKLCEDLEIDPENVGNSLSFLTSPRNSTYTLLCSYRISVSRFGR